MDVGELVARLRGAVGQVEYARTVPLLAAATAMDDARTLYGRLLGASIDHEAAQLAARMGTALEQAADAWHKCEAIEQAVTDYLARISATDTPTDNRPAPTPRSEPAAASSPPRPSAPAAPESPGAENAHGDRYPDTVAPAHEDLPPRVSRRALSVPMVGYVEINGRQTGRMTADRYDLWTEEVRALLVGLGLGRQRRLANHVEMKVVAMMH